MAIYQDAEITAKTYDQFGQEYHKHRVGEGRFFNEYLEMPATFSLLPKDLTGLTILDAGCGSGIYARKLSSLGAHVIGVDISKTMIDIPKSEIDKDSNIKYHVGNLYELDIASKSIDWIICNYVLENLEDINLVFKEFYRVLKPSGQCLYSISHPIRALSKKIKIGENEVWQLENYFSNDFRMSDFGNEMKVKKFNRTISCYINSAIKEGFKINGVHEPQPVEPPKAAFDSKEYTTSMHLPQLLIVTMKVDN